MSAVEWNDNAAVSLPLDDIIAEAQRVLSICNACRYCEGYCAVFPALERRLTFAEGDVHYLANLCHNCGACFYACQYAPPHEFALNLPRVLAQARNQTYRHYAWPRYLARAFDRNGTVTAIVMMVTIACSLITIAWLADPTRFFAAFSDAQQSFYALVPHRFMMIAFGAAFAFAVITLAIAWIRFVSEGRGTDADDLDPAMLASATRDAATLKYLDGGGDGCTYPRERPSFARRYFHHLTFYGFLLCFAATVVATFDHYVLRASAPYPLFSGPVVLGTLGGIGLILGPIGLLTLMFRRDADLGDPRQRGMDSGFLAFLVTISITGLLLLAMRETRAMGFLLALHLGAVMAFFVMLPYGKFVHGVYRFAALIRFHRERRLPQVRIGSE
jgi:citrate/tricarballylate utilization protein